MKMINDYVPKEAGAGVGVGLALRNSDGCYLLFMIPGEERYLKE